MPKGRSRFLNTNIRSLLIPVVGVAAITSNLWQVSSMTSTRADIVEIGGMQFFVGGVKQEPTNITGTTPTVGTLNDLNSATPGTAVHVRFPSGIGQNSVNMVFAAPVTINQVGIWENDNADRFPDVQFTVAYFNGSGFTTVGVYGPNTLPGIGLKFTKTIQ